MKILTLLPRGQGEEFGNRVVAQVTLRRAPNIVVRVGLTHKILPGCTSYVPKKQLWYPRSHSNGMVNEVTVYAKQYEGQLLRLECLGQWAWVGSWYNQVIGMTCAIVPAFGRVKYFRFQQRVGRGTFGKPKLTNLFYIILKFHSCSLSNKYSLILSASLIGFFSAGQFLK